MYATYRVHKGHVIEVRRDIPAFLMGGMVVFEYEPERVTLFNNVHGSVLDDVTT